MMSDEYVGQKMTDDAGADVLMGADADECADVLMGADADECADVLMGAEERRDVSIEGDAPSTPEQTGEVATSGKPLSRRKFMALGATSVAVVGIGGAAILVPTLTREDSGAPDVQSTEQPNASGSTSPKPVELKEKTTPKAAPDKADTAAEKETATVEPDPAAPKAEEGGSQAASGGSGSAGGSGAGTSNASGGVTGSDNWDAGNENNFGGNSGSDNKRVWHEPWDEWVNEGHWETTTVHHDEEVYSNWPVYGAKCDCGYTTDVPNILYAHLDETGHRGYVTGVQIDTKTHVVPAWEEKVEVWIDTSHWIHHEGYWE